MNLIKEKIDKILTKLTNNNESNNNSSNHYSQKKNSEHFYSQKINNNDENINDNNSVIINDSSLEIQSLDINLYIKMFIHELRTPISTISMGLTLIDNNDNDNKQIIKDLNQNILFIEEIFEKFAVIQDGRISLNQYELFSLKELLTNVNLIIQYNITENNILFNYNIQHNIIDLNYGDIHNIKHCIINLLKNAIKYRNLSHKTIINIQIYKCNEFNTDKKPFPPLINNINKRLESKRNLFIKNTQHFCISISDNNNDILPNIKNHLFECFNSTSGSGLGLYICKQIIELHGGTIDHHFIKPNGNNFVITLNLETYNDTSNNSNNSNHTTNSTRITNSNHFNEDINILLVDDSPLNLKIMYKVLENTKKFKNIFTTINHIEVIQKIEQSNNSINIIFIDKNMPDINGIILTKKIRELSYNGLIIGITGENDNKELNNFLESGLDYIFIKPLNNLKIKMIIDFLEKYGTKRHKSKKIQNVNDVLEWI